MEYSSEKNPSKKLSEARQIFQQPQLFAQEPRYFLEIDRGYWLEFLGCLASQYVSTRRNSVEKFIPGGWNFQINM